MRDERTERYFGPYKHRRRWRVILEREDGERELSSFESEAEAHEYIAAIETETDGRTVSAAIAEYVAHLTARGLRPGTVKTAEYRLRGLLAPTARERSLRGLTPTIARVLFENRIASRAAKGKSYKPDTQRGELDVASQFATWCVGKGWLRTDPFVGLEPTGPRSAGKPQLRIDEARKLYAVALAEFDAGIAMAKPPSGDEASNRALVVPPSKDGQGEMLVGGTREPCRASDRMEKCPSGHCSTANVKVPRDGAGAYSSGLATAMLLTMGMRVSGLTERTVRDVDDGGRVLWIDRSKTKAGEGAFAVPEELVPRLVALVESMMLSPARDSVAGTTAAEDGRSLVSRALFPGDRHWLAWHVGRLCRVAKVPEVTPHGLRGTFTSISGERRGIAEVAHVLGHASPEVTRRHYLAPGSEQRAKQRTALKVLQGGRK